MLRTRCTASASYGLPPARAKRPTTGTRPGRKTTALESRAPPPFDSKTPLAQTPLAWLRRKPGCEPLTCSNVSMKRSGVSARGVSHPPVYANATPTPATIAATSASRPRLAAPPLARRCSSEACNPVPERCHAERAQLLGGEADGCLECFRAGLCQRKPLAGHLHRPQEAAA